jgi:organic hydroperoxide reductase OsmC/OhrA
MLKIKKENALGDKRHLYRTSLTWIGHQERAASFKRHNRSYVLEVDGKPAIPGSSDPGFRGDPKRWNPEDLLLASLSSCHHLWFMYLCGQAGYEVLSYEDHAQGTMIEHPDGAGEFVEVTLCPKVRLAAGADAQKAAQLHELAHEKCFISRSVNFPVRHQPTFEIES